MIKPKGFNVELTSQNSLGLQTFDIMFRLGYWKKIVYTTNLKIGLQLCLAFCDSVNFRILLDNFASYKDRNENKVTIDKWLEKVFMKAYLL
jgi:ABC-type polysaccharide transport system permease subunit